MNEHLLVASWIHIRQLLHLDKICQPEGLDALTQKRDDFVVFFLNADDRVLRVHSAPGHLKSLDDLVRIERHELLVHAQQRFALGAVH